MDIRLIKKSECLMCPATIHDYSHTAFIEVVSFHGTEGYKDFFKVLYYACYIENPYQMNLPY